MIQKQKRRELKNEKPSTIDNRMGISIFNMFESDAIWQVSKNLKILRYEGAHMADVVFIKLSLEAEEQVRY
jgi:hypothetical protein